MLLYNEKKKNTNDEKKEIGRLKSNMIKKKKVAEDEQKNTKKDMIKN